MGMMAAIAVGISAGGAIAGGVNAKREGDLEAYQLEQAGGQEQAAAQRQAMEETRKSKLVQSRALAVAAASGGGASDPTVIDIISNIAGEGAYRSALALYEGDERARAMKLKGDAAKRTGKSQRTAGYIKGASTLMQGGASLYGKYAAGGPGGEIAYGSVDEAG